MRQGVSLLVALILIVGYACAGEEINSMVVGGKVLELVENRQITCKADGPVSGIWVSPNGASIACFVMPETGDEEDSPFLAKVLLVPASGSRPVTLMNCPREPEQIPPGYEQWMPYCLSGSVSWSPDSRMIAFPAMHFTYDGAKDDEGRATSSEKLCMVVVNTSGTRLASFAEDLGIPDSIVWSPDSKKIAFVISSETQSEDSDGESSLSVRLCVFDVAAGSAQTLYAASDCYVQILGWRQNGKALLCAEADEKLHFRLREVPLDGSVPKLIGDYQNPYGMSPNGKYRPVKGAAGMAFEECSTGNIVTVFKAPSGYSETWSPSDDVFTYLRPRDLKDENGFRRLYLYELWIACVEDHKLNHMCVALDVELDAPESLVSWSTDCAKLAYISRGRAFLAEMAWRDPDPNEKCAAGLPLSEDEVKEVMDRNASRILRAIEDYSFDKDGEYPPAATLSQDITPYLEDPDVLLKPGTKQPVDIQFFPPKPESSSSTEDVIELILDAGYDWRLVVYDYGLGEIVPKKQ